MDNICKEAELVDNLFGWVELVSMPLVSGALSSRPFIYKAESEKVSLIG